MARCTTAIKFTAICFEDTKANELTTTAQIMVNGALMVLALGLDFDLKYFIVIVIVMNRICDDDVVVSLGHPVPKKGVPTHAFEDDD